MAAESPSPWKPGFLVAKVSGSRSGGTREQLLNKDSRGIREQPKNGIKTFCLQLHCLQRGRGGETTVLLVQVCKSQNPSTKKPRIFLLADGRKADCAANWLTRALSDGLACSPDQQHPPSLGSTHYQLNPPPALTQSPLKASSSLPTNFTARLHWAGRSWHAPEYLHEISATLCS